MQRQATRADAFLKMLAYPIRDKKLRIYRPAVVALRQPDFFLAQRFAVRRAGVLLIRRTVGDVAVDDD
jgi:hypothetical protein